MLGVQNVKEPWSHFTALHLINGSRMLNLRSFVLHAGTRQKRFAEDSAINDSRLTFTLAGQAGIGARHSFVAARGSPKR
jgi:hypothetical protein